jgi:hypothetical protein
MAAIVHAADVQDRDGGVLLMATLFGLLSVPAEALCRQRLSGAKFQRQLKRVCRTVNEEIVRRGETGKFGVLPKRWIVERTIGWFNRCRRLGNDWECLSRNALAFLRWASVRLMLRKVCQNRT